MHDSPIIYGPSPRDLPSRYFHFEPVPEKVTTQGDAAPVDQHGISQLLDLYAGPGVISQSTPAKQQIWNANVGGRPYIQCNGTSQWSAITGISSTTGNFLIWAVIDAATATGSRAIADFGSGRLILTNGNFTATNKTGIYDGNAWYECAAATTGKQLLVYDCRTGTTQMKAYRNGVQIGSAATYTATKLASTPLASCFGGQFDGSQNYFSGKIYAFGCCRGGTDTQLNQLTGMMLRKFSLP